MNIRYHRHFEKRYQKLPTAAQQKVRSAITRFAKNPQDPKLKNHALTGRLKGLRAFSVASNIRIIFEEYDGYTLVVMLDVGTHAQVYK